MRIIFITNSITNINKTLTMSSKTIEPNIECNVCCEEVKSSVYCGTCSYVACQGCFQKYLLTVPSARCMNCKSAFTEHFLRMYLPQGWIERNYKPHVKEQLFQLEKSKLSGDVELAKINLRIQKLKFQKKISSENWVDVELRILNGEYNQMLNQSPDQDKNKPKPIVYKRPCSQADCRGFLNDDWQCGLCQVEICKDCRTVIDKLYNHKCDDATLKSVELINKETKNCPTCSEPIFKPFGCDHMFCTVCKSSFSWNTGLLIPESKQTNPLYKEYLKKMGSKNECDHVTFERVRYLSSILFTGIRLTYQQEHSKDQIINSNEDREFLSQVLTFKNFTTTESSQIISIFRTIINIENSSITLKTTNREIRVQYLSKKINDNEFKTKIYSNYKRYEYLQEINNLRKVVYSLLIEWWKTLMLHVYEYQKKYMRESSIYYNNGTTEVKFIAAQNRDQRTERLYFEIFHSRTSKGVYLLDISSFQHKNRPEEILNFFNKESIKLAELYGYTQTWAFHLAINSPWFELTETNIKFVDTNIKFGRL